VRFSSVLRLCVLLFFFALSTFQRAQSDPQQSPSIPWEIFETSLDKWLGHVGCHKERARVVLGTQFLRAAPALGRSFIVLAVDKKKKIVFGTHEALVRIIDGIGTRVEFSSFDKLNASLEVILDQKNQFLAYRRMENNEVVEECGLYLWKRLEEIEKAKEAKPVVEKTEPKTKEPEKKEPIAKAEKEKPDYFTKIFVSEPKEHRIDAYWGDINELDSRLFKIVHYRFKGSDFIFEDETEMHPEGIDSILDDSSLRAKLQTPGGIANAISDLQGFTISMYFDRSLNLSDKAVALKFIEENKLEADDVLEALILFRFQSRLVPSGKANLNAKDTLLETKKMDRAQFKALAQKLWDTKNSSYVMSDLMSERIKPFENLSPASFRDLNELLESRAEINKTVVWFSSDYLVNGKDEESKDVHIWSGDYNSKSGFYIYRKDREELKFLSIPDASFMKRVKREKTKFLPENDRLLGRFKIEGDPDIDSVFIHYDEGSSEHWARFFSETTASYKSFDPRSLELEIMNVLELAPIEHNLRLEPVDPKDLMQAKSALAKLVRLGLSHIVTSRFDSEYSSEIKKAAIGKYPKADRDDLLRYLSQVELDKVDYPSEAELKAKRQRAKKAFIGE
jgi:hypothetical protein